MLQAYFCGHYPFCAEHGSVLALDMAKVNIERWFPVVWVMEDPLISFRVMEAKLPKFFSGVVKMHYEAKGRPGFFYSMLESAENNRYKIQGPFTLQFVNYQPCLVSSSY